MLDGTINWFKFSTPICPFVLLEGLEWMLERLNICALPLVVLKLIKNRA